MFQALGPEALGIRGLSLPEAIELARAAGFAGLAFNIAQAADLADAHGVDHVRDLFARAGVRPAHWNLPLDWRQPGEEAWRAGLATLPRLAAVAAELGADRTATYMPSGSDDRPFAENLAWHVARLRPIAEILRDAGCRFGIEYIGPATYRAQFRHPFVHTLAGTLELIAAIGLPNVGLMLDSWHLYTAGEAAADLAQLTNDQVVVVHVNDAPAGVARDEQIDTVRALPTETGVIDLAAFIGALRTIGYDGPVMPEPFSARLAGLAAGDPAAAVGEAARSMRALWEIAGLPSEQAVRAGG
jgi:sugar phosphate isomerase/epimerase